MTKQLLITTLLIIKVSVLLSQITINTYGANYGLDFNPDGTILASGGNDNFVHLYDPSDGSTIALLNFLEHDEKIRSIDFNNTGNRLVSGAEDDKIKVWNITTMEHYYTLTNPHDNNVLAVSYSHDGNYFISGSSDNKIKIFTSGGQEVSTLIGHGSSVSSLDISPDGSTIVSGSYDKFVKLWDFGTASCTRTMGGHSKEVYTVKFSPDGNLVASGSRDNTIKIWDVATGNCLLTLEGHTDRINTLIFSNDGSRIISGGYDEKVKIWDVQYGYCIQTLSFDCGTIYSLAISPDDQTLAIGGFGKIIISPSHLEVEETKESMDHLIVNNPVKDRLTLNIPEDMYTIEIYNLSGQNLWQSNGYRSNDIDVSMLPAGSYFIKISNSSTLLKERFIKQ